MSHLLIAGPLALDDHPAHKDLLGGVAGYAAIAAAPLVRTQLWCRGGSDITQQMRAILTQRGIDLSGVSWEGRTPRGRASGFEANGPTLPDLEPTEADDLGAALLIGLPPEEFRRAVRVLAALEGAETRPIVVSPRMSDLSDPAWRAEVCRASDVLILPGSKAQELTGTTSMLAAAEACRTDGAKSVVLTARQVGGLILYHQKTTTYPAIPVTTVDAAGVSAAFPGAVAAWIGGNRRADFSTLKRACAMASGVAAICAQGIGPKRLLQADRAEYLDRFNRIRREQKF